MDTAQASDQWLRVLCRALWVCRVPFASSSIALLLFLNLPQARDLFIEIKGSTVAGVFFWACFYAFVGFAWLLPLYCGARLALECQGSRIGTGDGSRCHWFNFAIPAGIVLLCLTALILGNAYSFVYLLDSTDDNVENLAKRHLMVILVITTMIAIGAAALFVLTARRGFVHQKRKSQQPAPSPDRTKTRAPRINSAFEKITKFFTGEEAAPFETKAYLAFLLALSFLTPLLWIFPPGALADLFPRAMMAPILLGFWVAPLTLLGVLSHRVRLPLILFFIVVCMALDSLIDNHKIRTVPANEGRERPTLKQTVEYWRTANKCTPGIWDASCRKPIIVAAAGGASRAAFFTASVLGFLEDLSTADRTRFNRFGDQLFAISSVSGSSVGAATYMALRRLVEQHPGDNVLRKAREAAPADGLWYGNQVEIGQVRSGPTQWKDALQIILAGDFLTPPAAAWMFRDLLPVGSLLRREDRAAVLEKAWEKRFRQIFGVSDLENPMMRSLISYRPHAGRWLPILFLNGSMVENGKRVIASPIAPATEEYPCRVDCYPEPLTEFYTDAYDFHDLINGRTTVYEERDLDEERRIKSDVRLSTAALLSARFPGISPHGTIKNKNGHTVGHIVDGGYFENNGALTTIDVVNGLKIISTAGDPTAGHRRPCWYAADDKQDPKCKPEEVAQVCKAADDNACPKQPGQSSPLIIQILNEPEPNSCGEDGIDPAARLTLPIVDWFRAFPSLMYVIDAVLGARVARGTHASELLSYSLDNDKEGYFAAYDSRDPGFAHFRVCPQPLTEFDQVTSQTNSTTPKEQRFRDVSMNWWLSKPVQSYLNDQLCNNNNKKALVSVLMALSKEVAKTPPDQEQRLDDLRRGFEDEVKQRCNALKARKVSVPAVRTW